MKKVFVLIFFFLLIYIALRIGYRFYGKGHDYSYIIETQGTEFEIQETFLNNKENSNYYFEIKKDEQTFYYQTFENFKNDSKIIKDIYYYEDEKYQCILPVYLGDKILSDILCKNSNDNFYFYHSLKGVNDKLDDFASSLITYGYNVEQWGDSSEFVQKDRIISYYQNIPNNHIIVLTDYKGLILLNGKGNKINYISLFNSDVYQKKFDVIYQNKYVVADYNSKYRFHEFFVVDIISGQQEKIISKYELSFDSYVQGIVDNRIYFFDRDAKKQFTINMKNYTVSEVGNESKGIKLYNGIDWQTISAVTASKEKILFKDKNDLEVETEGYIKIEKYGTENFGYYYYYKKVDDKYLLYRANVQDNSQLVYLFTTTDLDKICFFNQDIYFVDEGDIKKYSDKLGIRKVLEYEELKYNTNLLFGVYINR